MDKILECPICSGKDFSTFIICKDYSVSQENFIIDSCHTCGLLFTNPRPSKNDIGKYYESDNYISHSNSTKGLFNKTYHIIRQIALKQKLKLIEREISPGLKREILDIGCGTGEFLNTCKKAGWYSEGIEPNDKARKQATINYGLIVSDEIKIDSIKKGSKSIVTMWHVLEHVHDLNQRIKQLNDLLSPSGKAIIAVPNPTSWDANEYKEFWAAYDVPRHLYHFQPAVIKNLFESNGFIHERSFPMPFDSFYVSILSEKYRRGTSGILKALINGLKSNLAAKRNGEKYSSTIYVFRKP